MEETSSASVKGNVNAYKMILFEELVTSYFTFSEANFLGLGIHKHVTDAHDHSWNLPMIIVTTF